MLIAGKQNLNFEKQWYRKNPWRKKGHFLQKWPFIHPERQLLAFQYVRQETRKVIQDYLNRSRQLNKNKSHIFQRGLVAPCGTNADQDILDGMAEKFYGIDISEKALKLCPKNIVTKKGDILNNGYKSQYFDFIASFLFFHHVHQVGFGSFLKEFNRILKPGGVLVILEPSVFYPFGWLTWLGRIIFGNVSGLVPHERPILPGALDLALKKNGFEIKEFESISFSHNRIPVLFQKLINKTPRFLRRTPPFSKMGWICLWICQKTMYKN